MTTQVTVGTTSSVVNVTRGIQTSVDVSWVQGLSGPKGDPGLSAYEVAVESGFTGTEAEWLDSLHGGGGSPILMDISIVDGELIADYLAQLSPSIVDGEFIVSIL